MASHLVETADGRGMKPKTGSEQKIVINVGGIKHQTFLSTLERFPGTRLAVLAKLREQDDSYDVKANEYFFDRNPQAFLSIIEYYRQDELHMAEHVCGNVMKKELDYWGIYEAEIEPCCWGVYARLLDHKETLAHLDNTFGTTGPPECDMQKMSAWKRFQTKVWLNLEYPSTSRGAKLMMFISILFVLTSIVAFIAETHHLFRVIKYENGTTEAAPDPEGYYRNKNAKDCCSTGTPWVEREYPETEPHKYLNYIDWGCVGFFVLELFIRFIFAPSKCEYLKGPLNIIDIICIVPQTVSMVIEILEVGDQWTQYGSILKVITILRTVRILRVFKLMKHYSAFKILAYTIKVSTKELLLMVVFLMTGVMIFSSLIYYAENKNFTSIPLGFWWALVTMTTVGYGDQVPVEPMGYGIGCLCVIGGVWVIAFTVPIVVNNFQLYYSHAQSRTNLPVNMKHKRIKKPSLVSVQPAGVGKRDAETPVSANTTDENIQMTYESNWNIKRSEHQSTNKLGNETQPSTHWRQARQLVDNLAERNQQLMSERRKQYMLAFKRMEEKRKDKPTM